MEGATPGSSSEAGTRSATGTARYLRTWSRRCGCVRGHNTGRVFPTTTGFRHRRPAWWVPGGQRNLTLKMQNFSFRDLNMLALPSAAHCQAKGRARLVPRQSGGPTPAPQTPGGREPRGRRPGFGLRCCSRALPFLRGPACSPPSAPQHTEHEARHQVFAVQGEFSTGRSWGFAGSAAGGTRAGAGGGAGGGATGGAGGGAAGGTSRRGGGGATGGAGHAHVCSSDAS